MAEHLPTSRIPIRNLWVLLLYASDLAALAHRTDGAFEPSPDLPTLVARVLVELTQRRLRRNLSRGYVDERAVLARVRGRIDILGTLATGALERGQVACRFEDLTVDTPRNRLVRAALEHMEARVDDPAVRRDCRALARTLGSLGVGSEPPSRTSTRREQLGRNDTDDRALLVFARLAFDLFLPVQGGGAEPGVALDDDEVLLRRIFEKAVAGFYRVELPGPGGWRVRAGTWLDWSLDAETPGLLQVLPAMQTDIVLDDGAAGRRIVIDTKFTRITRSGRFARETLKSGYLYQMYAYLRSQEAIGDTLANAAEGILLHPSVGVDVDESAMFQGHRIRFVTVDLAGSFPDVRARLLGLVNG